MGFIVPPSKWEIQHAGQIFAAQNYQAAHGGQLPDTRMWRMLEFRHDLNTGRFNFYHPNIGRMIAAQGATPTPTPTPVPQVIDPGVEAWSMPPLMAPMEIAKITEGGTSAPPPGPPIPLGVAPEPASFVMLAAAILAMGLGFHGFRRRSA